MSCLYLDLCKLIQTVSLTILNHFTHVWLHKHISLTNLFVLTICSLCLGSNFLYDTNTNKINLIDFGASRSYNKLFVDEYLRMVYFCTINDRNGVINSSIKLGFLTGDESIDM